MNLKTTTFEPAAYLKTPAEISTFLNDAFATGSPEEIIQALGIAAKAQGMTQVAAAANLGRESLYKAFKPGSKPEFATAWKVMSALGLQVVAKPLTAARKPQTSRTEILIHDGGRTTMRVVSKPKANKSSNSRPNRASPKLHAGG